MRFQVDLGEQPAQFPGVAVVLSPDGERLAYVAGSPSQIHLRLVGEFEGNAMSGTEGAEQPFFSPDGQWIGFFADDRLKKVSIFGGATMKLADVQAHRGGWWSEDGTIVYSPDTTSGLKRINEAGGEPEVLTDVGQESGFRSHRWPQVLPGGGAVLYTAQPSGQSFDEAQIEVLDLASGERKVVATGGSFGRYAPSGHLTYVHEGTLFAMPFDLNSLTASGAPVPVVEEVSYDVRNGGARMQIAAQGHLVYESGTVLAFDRTVVRVAQDGTVTPILTEVRDYSRPRVSPDGTRLLVDFSPSSSYDDVWIYDLARAAMTRMTFTDQGDFGGIWTPDGSRIAFSSLRNSGVPNIHWKAADGSGQAERLTESAQAQWPLDFSPDGRLLLFQQEETGTGWGLYTLDLADGTETTYLQTEFNEAAAEFSPDGRWVAYASNESGDYQVYVRPFPAGGGRWQVSNDRGAYPAWSHDGKTIYYSTEGKLMSVEVTTDGGVFRADAPQLLIDGSMFAAAGWTRRYDLTPDGDFVVTVEGEPQSEQEPARTMLVLNWIEELKQRSK
jgi:serine/threonine-protein kinase